MCLSASSTAVGKAISVARLCLQLCQILSPALLRSMPETHSSQGRFQSGIETYIKTMLLLLDSQRGPHCLIVLEQGSKVCSLIGVLTVLLKMLQVVAQGCPCSE